MIYLNFASELKLIVKVESESIVFMKVYFNRAIRNWTVKLKINLFVPVV